MKNIFFSGPSKMTFIVAVIGRGANTAGHIERHCLSRIWDKYRQKSRKYIIISFFRLEAPGFRDP